MLAAGDPVISKHFRGRQPSVIRLAQMEFKRRGGRIQAVNVAIGNVSLPMHPAMVRAMAGLGAAGSPFAAGVVKYTATAGTEEARSAVLHVIASSGLETEGLHVQITDGGSQAMELMVLGVCGPPGSAGGPLLVIDPTYTNYKAMAQRLGRAVVSARRELQEDGRFSLPAAGQLEGLVLRHRPAALLVIPYDNPAGQLYSRAQMEELAALCVRHNLWMVSDEAYRELYYNDGQPSSVWGLAAAVPGIKGRRIGIESASKVWNACGLRIGALVTDNEELHRRSVAENTANLCPNAIGQHIFASLRGESYQALQGWYEQQRSYYRTLAGELTAELRRQLPKAIVSVPQASLYSVVDVRRMVDERFDALEFVLYCAREGAVRVGGGELTLLVAPMAGFYDAAPGENPGRTQMRISYVEPAERMRLVPMLLRRLLERYLAR